MDVIQRAAAGLLLIAVSTTAFAQTRSAVGRGLERVNPQRNVAPIPRLDCRKLLANDPRPWAHAYCEHVDFSMQATWPIPSADRGRPGSNSTFPHWALPKRAPPAFPARRGA
ncbi:MULTISPECIES: hypothetical protein [unclassified Xanthomonas]|uniref:hypothetical protein n=1 Tax=Xanthomonas sp. LMG 8992 TaxID=1591157 RepID=UPI001369249C|nr:hypothetical protein [Xanthomonas sp. LMG 8992]